MQKQIRAIETTYNGVKFRSRLEARWARFFDNLRTKWIYEHEGYQIEDGYYLPDFFLPNVYLRAKDAQGILFEVKPARFGEEYGQLEQVGTRLKIGSILANGFDYANGVFEGLYQITPFWDNFMDVCVCETCGAVKFEFQETNYMQCPACSQRYDSHSAEHIAWAYDEALKYRYY